MAKKTADELFHEEPSADDLFAEGEPGHASSNRYTPGETERQRAQSRHQRRGDLGDTAKAWADTAALGAGPQIAGAIGAVANAVTNPLGDRVPGGTSDVDAYRSVRDDTAKELNSSHDTMMGGLGDTVGVFSTPVPVKSLGPGATVGQKALQGAKVGAVAGAIHGGATSSADLTKMDSANLKRFILDSLFEGASGAAGGGLTGAAMSTAETPLRSASRKLPMDMLGVSEPARRSMQRQGIYDAAGDDLLALVRPGRSGMRKGSLTKDALAELTRRGESLDDIIGAVDARSPGGTVTTGSMADAIQGRAKPFSGGSLQDKQVASRMNKEASNLLDTLGSTDPEIGARIPLTEAEAFKQRFSPAVAKDLRHAGEPASKTTALAETYRALKGANEAGVAEVSPELAAKFVDAKKAYGRIAAPLEGANVERSGMRGSDFDLGALLSEGPQPKSVLEKLGEIPGAGFVKVPLDLVGRAYGRGLAANAAEFGANRMANNTGGVVGASLADEGLRRWLRLLKPETDDEQQR